VIRLGVNIDHVATLRQVRGTRFPDPVQAAMRPSRLCGRHYLATCVRIAATFRNAMSSF